MTRERGQDRVGVLFSSSLPPFSKASLRVAVARVGTFAPQAPVSFFYSSTSQESVEIDVSDIHSCRSTLQGTGRPSPGYLSISSAIRN